jgi:glutaminyl-tRNA synthetase
MMDNEIKTNFIWDAIDAELLADPKKKVHTRFPPEPNGYLHIGHAKAININFTTALKYNGLCNLRFDDTNPSKEDTEYVDSIQEDIKWLGFDWGDRMFYASSYFDRLYGFACDLILKGSAYVDDLSASQIHDARGTLTEPGIDSPYRNRSVTENMDLFTRMKNGEYPDGARVLRAKIDMGSPNMNMRDPVIYRIQKSTHHMTGDAWCIYPMYDFAHPLSDWIENITFSLCSLEFEDHRILYDWFLKELELPDPPRQMEFARLYVTGTLMSKRKLMNLVNENIVDGWDDPRMPTLCGLRRRGYTSSSVRSFCDSIGISKTNSVVDYSYLEHCIRDELNRTANRVMAILDPLEVEITNYPDGMTEYFEADNNPEDPDSGKRTIPFTKNIFIERDDFMIDPPGKFFRLRPGSEVRLMNAFIAKCTGYDMDKESGKVNKVYCTVDSDSRGGNASDGRKIKGTIHWLSIKHAARVKVNIYDKLFMTDDPAQGGDIYPNINPDSLKTAEAYVEPQLLGARPGDRFQFIRNAYFCADTKYSKTNEPVFNKIVGLKDSWAKMNKDL